MQSSTDCFANDPIVWTSIGQQTYTSCYNQCTYPNSDVAASVIVDSSLKQLSFLLPIDLTTISPHSYTVIEMIYAKVFGLSLQSIANIDLNTWNNNANIPHYYYVEQGAQMQCNSYGSMEVDYTSNTLQGQINQNSMNIKISFPSLGTDIVLIRSVKIWINCTLNCKICKDSTNCSVCQESFKTHTLSSGQVVCEQTSGCQGSNCFSCAQDNNQSICLRCKLGYDLDIYQNCQPLQSCPSGQYYDTRTLNCQQKSSTCYFQKRDNQQFIPCLFQDSNFQQLCKYDEVLLFYDIRLPRSYDCTKIVSKCILFSSFDTCDQCQVGYTYDSYFKACMIPCSQSQPGYYYDPATDSCKQCNGINCQQCNYQQCTTCSQTGYVLDPNNIQNCNICQIQNCSVCQFNGYQCKTCSNGFYLNIQTKQCEVCQVSHCLTCNKDNSQQCVTCDINNGYYLNSLTKKCEICQVSNCLKCDSNNSKICVNCNTNIGYYLVATNQQCETCQVINCSVCNTNNSLICVSCNTGFNLSIDQLLCITSPIPPEVNKMDVQENLRIDGYDIILAFKKQLQIKANINLSQAFKVDIQQVQIQQIIAHQISDKEILLQLYISNDCKYRTLQIQAIDSQLINDNNLDSNQYNIKLNNLIFISESQKQLAESTQTANESVTKSIVSSIAPIAIFGNFYIIFNTIDMTSIIYYLLFVNVRYPINMIFFCNTFKYFQFPFIPNIFSYMMDSNYNQTSPSKFTENNTGAYFIANAGQSITICIGIVFIFIFYKLMSYFPIERINTYFGKSIRNTWHLSGFLDMVGTVYIYINVGAFLQFYSFDISEPKNSAYLNYILFALSTLFVVAFPFTMLYIFSKDASNIEDKEFLRKYNTMLNGVKLFKLNDLENLKKEAPTKYDFNKLSNVWKYKQQYYQTKLSKYVNPLTYARKLFFSFFIVFLHDYTPIQIMLITILNFFLIIYYFYILPYEKLYDNIKNGISEICLIIIQVCCLILKDDNPDQSEEDRITIGWYIVASASLIIFVHTISIILEILNIIYKICGYIIKKIYNLRNSFTKNKEQKSEPYKTTSPDSEKIQLNKIKIIGPDFVENDHNNLKQSQNQNILTSRTQSISHGKQNSLTSYNNFLLSPPMRNQSEFMLMNSQLHISNQIQQSTNPRLIMSYNNLCTSNQESPTVDPINQIPIHQQYKQDQIDYIQDPQMIVSLKQYS